MRIHPLLPVAMLGWCATLSAQNPTPQGPEFLSNRGQWPGVIQPYVGLLDTSLPPAQQLLFLTYQGATARDEGANDIVLEQSGLITVCGPTEATAFPITPGAYSTTYNGGSWDSWVARFDPWPGAGRPRVYSSFVGGFDFEYAYSVDVTDDGSAVLAVNAGSTNFPSTIGPAHAGGTNDAAVTVLDMLPAQVSRYGGPSPPCHGPLYLSVNSFPNPGNGSFEIYANQAPPNSFGVLILSGVAPSPVNLLGVDVWVTLPAPPGITTISDARGFARFPIPLPLFIGWPFGGWQTAWVGTCSTVVGSDALQ